MYIEDYGLVFKKASYGDGPPLLTIREFKDKAFPYNSQITVGIYYNSKHIANGVLYSNKISISKRFYYRLSYKNQSILIKNLGSIKVSDKYVKFKL